MGVVLGKRSRDVFGTIAAAVFAEEGVRLQRVSCSYSFDCFSVLGFLSGAALSQPGDRGLQLALQDREPLGRHPLSVRGLLW